MTGWEPILRILSHVKYPGTIALIGAFFAAAILLFFHKSKKQAIPRILAVGIIVLALAPITADTFLQSRGIYRVRITLLGLDTQPDDNAVVNSSVGGEFKKVKGGWEVDIPPQIRPADGKVTFYGSDGNAFLTGECTFELARDYYPTITVHLASDNSARIRGRVIDENHLPIIGALVSILGYAETPTDDAGNFDLAAHAADGQIVELRVRKGRLTASGSFPAGKMSVEIMLSRH
jgi:hypothetical protein